VYLELLPTVAKILTQSAVAKIKGDTAKTRIIRDAASRGLFLIVQTTGAKSWLMRWRRPGGGEDKITLGPVDLSGRTSDAEPQIGMPLSLVAARRLAAKLNADRAGGIDVIGAHKAAKHRRRVAIVEAHEHSFLEAARAFIAEHAKPKVRTWKELARNLGLDEELQPRPGGLVARWADRNIQTVTASDLHVIVEESRKLGIPGIEVRQEKATETRAHKMHAALSSMFGWLQKRRRITNPMQQLHPPSLPSARDRVLNAVEIRAFWNATYELKTTVGDALKLVLITGARLNEIVRLEWSEVSLDASLNVGGVITIPGSRTKNGLPLVLELPPLGRDLIDRQPRNGPYVFAANSVVAVTVGSKIKSRLDALMGNPPPWRLHDLRRSVATGMAQLGVLPHVIEAVLNHASGQRSGVAGIYNRFTYAPEKKAALEKWAAHLELIVGAQP
jgi:integrase